jgi:WD40 repeat protein
MRCTLAFSWLLSAFLLAFASATEAAAPPNVRRDLHGDPLPLGAVARIGTVRWRHVNADYVRWVGNDLLASVACGELRLWDVKTGRVARTMNTGETEAFRSASALSADGKFLALVANSKVRLFESETISLYDVNSGRLLWRIASPGPRVSSLTFSPDGKRLAARFGQVGLFDVTTGKVVPFERPRDSEDGFSGGHDGGASLAFSPDGQFLAGVERAFVCVWRAGTGKLIYEGKHTLGWSRCVALSPDGKELAWDTEWDKKGPSIRVASLATGEERLVLRAPEGRAHALIFSPDGKLLVSLHDKTAWLWGLATGKPLRRLEGNLGGVRFLHFSPDGKTLAGVTDRLRRWDVATGKEHPPRPRPRSRVFCVAVSADGTKVATGDNSACLTLWEARTGKALRVLVRGDPGTVAMPLAFSPNGQALAADVPGDARLVLWDLNTGKGKGLVGDADFWDLAFSPNGKALVGVGEAGDRVVAWSLSTARPPHLLTGLPRGKDRSGYASLSAHGCCTVAWTKTAAQARSLVTRRHHPWFNLPGSGFRMAVSPDGRVVAFWCEPGPSKKGNPAKGPHRRASSFFVLVEAITGKERSRWPVNGTVTDLDGGPTFGPDGLLAFAVGGEVRVHDTVTGKELARLRGHQADVTGLAFSADGRLLVSASIDATALVWELPRPERAARVDLPPGRREALWADLAGADAARAGLAITALVRERSAAFLEGKLRQEAHASGRRCARFVRLTTDLGSADFTTREQAMQALREGADEAEPALHRALARKPELEARLRLAKLLAERDGAAPSPRWARVVRALEALERMGGPEARQALDAIAREGEGPVAWEARAAWARLASRPPR